MRSNTVAVQLVRAPDLCDHFLDALRDVAKKCLVVTVDEAHREAVASLEFIPNEPILLSSGGDNSLKQWIFDQADGCHIPWFAA